MSFFKTARAAGAAEYGRVRAETYGRRAKLTAGLGGLAAVVLVFAILWVAGGPLG